MDNIKIVVATHKDYWMPDDPVYLPLHVGAAISDPLTFAGDDTGDNISSLNGKYCELTGLYWAWKNLKDADYIGLVHYRRHFRGHLFGSIADRIAGGEYFRKAVSKADIIVPRKRWYFIETIYSHYIHSHYQKDLEVTRGTIVRMCPEYLRAFDKVMSSRGAHMFNMMVMSKERLNEYCSWLFPILKAVESRLDVSSYSEFDQRVFGRISELLLNVWLAQDDKEYVNAPVVFLEEDWVPKVRKMIRRKFVPEHAAR